MLLVGAVPQVVSAQGSPKIEFSEEWVAKVHSAAPEKASAKSEKERKVLRSERYLGRLEEVLVEGSNPKKPEQVVGRTRTNRPTFFPGQRPDGRAIHAGALVTVQIEAVRPFSLSGKLA